MTILSIEDKAKKWLKEKLEAVDQAHLEASAHVEREYDGAKRLLNLGFDGRYCYMSHYVGGLFAIAYMNDRPADKQLAAVNKLLRKFPYKYSYAGDNAQYFKGRLVKDKV